MTKGTIFNIQHFCLDDGPGIRTTVFLKGCPLRCLWCHNPESHKTGRELLTDLRLCIGCGACASVCPGGAHQISRERLYHRDLCTACGACAERCPADALELAGREVTAAEVLAEVLRERRFYEESGGGLTISGGEPLYQAAFSCDLLREAKNAGLHTCVETCGYASAETVKKAAEVTDLFLYDWKLTDPLEHQRNTGVGNEIIRENLLLLDHLEKQVIFRCPIIPGVNDTQEHFAGIGALADLCSCVLHVELEPYHPLGAEKSLRLGKTPCKFLPPSQETVSQWREQLTKYTHKPIKIG